VSFRYSCETCLNNFDDRSKEWVCPHCQQPNLELLPHPSPESEASTSPKTLESLEVSNNAPERAQPLNVAIDQPPALESYPSTASPRGVNDTEERRVVPILRTSVALAHSRRSSHKPPLLLDTAICVLLVLVFGIICRRMV
jgi:ubiquitin-conjugating enzyme E2 J1